MVNSENHKRFLNIEIARILLAFCSGFTSDVDLSSDIISIIAGYVRSYILKRDEKKRPLCNDIKMLMYSENPSIGRDNSNHKFSFLECLNFGYGSYKPTIGDFISYKNVRRRLAPLDTRTNNLLSKDNIETHKLVYPEITDINDIKRIIIDSEFFGEHKSTAIDVINLIRRALNGEISYDMDDSDPNWSSCNIELYNVDTRYFTFYRGENTRNPDNERNPLRSSVEYELEKILRFDEYCNCAGFLWVSSPSCEYEYGRLFFKPDSHVCEGFWNKTLSNSLEYFSGY